jgi:hypothetical protein
VSIPGWILDIFAAIMLLVAAVSAGQLVVARAWTRHGASDADIAGSHLLMGVAMAGMLVAGLSTLPNAAWEAIFAAMTAWFAWSLWREARGRGAGALARGHHAPHLVHSAAMFYAFAALAGPASSGGSGMAGMAGGSSSGMQTLKLPTLALVFVLALVAYTVRDLDRRACADGYFHVVGRRFAPAGPALATAGPGGAGPSGAGPGGAGPGGVTGIASGARAQSAGGGDTAVATVTQPRTTQAAQASAAGTGTARPDTSAERLLLAPGVVKACRVAMGVTMAFMLIIMI